jgi:hypothetical protein
MKQSAMADRDDARDMADGDRGRDRELLRREAESRESRIKLRREQQRKKELARKLAKRKRMFKVAGVWLGVIIAGFLVVAWFTPSVVTWLHTLGK